MISILTGDELNQTRALANSMFVDRARQFHDRLGWKVTIDGDGQEKDQYDLPHTLYVIAVDDYGLHAGSMRFLPTTSNSMISDHFRYLVENIDFVSPFIWECSRFCLSEKVSPKSTALELFGAGAILLQKYQLAGFIGLFDPLMERVYRRYGVAPEVIQQAKDNDGKLVKLGIWHNDNLIRTELLCKIAQAKHKFEGNLPPARILKNNNLEFGLQ